MSSTLLGALGNYSSPGSSLLSLLYNTGTFKIKKSLNGQYFWNLAAANGEKLCHSETYPYKQSAKKGLESCKTFAPIAEIIDETTLYGMIQRVGVNGAFRLKVSNNNQYYWVLVASNGETLCQSETYISKQSAVKGIDSCKRNASTAQVTDEA